MSLILSGSTSSSIRDLPGSRVVAIARGDDSRSLPRAAQPTTTASGSAFQSSALPAILPESRLPLKAAGGTPPDRPTAKIIEIKQPSRFDIAVCRKCGEQFPRTKTQAERGDVVCSECVGKEPAAFAQSIERLVAAARADLAAAKVSA